MKEDSKIENVVIRKNDLRVNIERTQRGIDSLSGLDDTLLTMNKKDMLLQLNRAQAYLYRQLADLIEEEIKLKEDSE